MVKPPPVAEGPTVPDQHHPPAAPSFVEPQSLERNSEVLLLAKNILGLFYIHIYVQIYTNNTISNSYAFQLGLEPGLLEPRDTLGGQVPCAPKIYEAEKMKTRVSCAVVHSLPYQASDKVLASAWKADTVN